MTLFLCGDVMTGRGVDQILAHPSGHRIFEPYVADAREYVALAEARSGSIARPVTAAYVWGDALAELDRLAPGAGIANLETAITVSDDYWRGKGIHYRMHPHNLDCLTAARLDVCVLANNHVLDWGYAGLVETLDALAGSGIRTVGAGRNLAEARAPAVMPLAGGTRLIVFAFATETSGVFSEWAAREKGPGVDYLPDLSEQTAAAVLARVRRVRSGGDLVVASVHWGTNWGYEVPADHVRFARRLIDGGVDLVHGHSSHHPRPIEVYRGRLILYGCGDLINDYEGIEGHEQYRDDLVLMYFATLAMPAGVLTALDMAPMQIRRLRLNNAARSDTHWLRDTLDAVSAPFGSRVDVAPDGGLTLRWR